MKFKSYNLLFRIFSYLSDKTNGAPLFVKYKLLLGTLIISMVSTSAKAQKKEVTGDTIIPHQPVPAEITCYKPAMPPRQIQQSSDSLEIHGVVKDKEGEPLIGAIVTVRNTSNGIIANEEGIFNIKAKPNDILIFSLIGYKPQEIQVSKIKERKVIVILEEDDMILCYEVVIVKAPHPNWDDIYAKTQSPHKIKKLSYTEVQTPPISPVGNLDAFQKWVQSNIRYTDQMQMGKVTLSFTIDKKGKLVNKKVTGKLSKEADKEAIRVLSLSERWKPGKHYDDPVKTTMTITVHFGNEK